MVAPEMRALPTNAILCTDDRAPSGRLEHLSSLASRASLRRLALALGLAAGLSTAAHAEAPVADNPPILDDLDQGRRLAPPPGTLSGDVVIEKKKEEPKLPKLARDVSMVVAHGRYTTVPDFMLDMFFVDHPGGIVGPSIGIAFETGDLDDTMWAFELNWTPYSPDPGNWLELGAEATDATYAENGLHFISIDASYRNQIRFTQGFRAMVGGGLGLGILAGDLDTAEVLPTCESPIAECAHWPRATAGNADLPTRIAPVLHFLAGLEVDLGAGLTLRAQGGFRNAFYAGLSVGKSL